MIEFLTQTLDLPPRATILKNLPKVEFIRNLDLSAADRKLLGQAISKVTIITTFSPTNVNIPAYQDQDYRYDEVLVLAVETTEKYLSQEPNKLNAFLQRSFPYPLVLWLWDGDKGRICLQDKQVNQADGTKLRAGQDLCTPVIQTQELTIAESQFRQLIKFDKLDKTNLQTLYFSLLQAVLALLLAPDRGAVVARPAAKAPQDLNTWFELLQLRRNIAQHQALTSPNKSRYLPMPDQIAHNQQYQSLLAQAQLTLQELVA